MMDSGSSSYSRTRSGLVRRKGILAPSRNSCSRTRSGLVRVKSFMHSRGGSCSRTRSGLVRIKNFVDSDDSSCSGTQSDSVSGSPHAVEVLIKDEAVLKGSPDEWMKEDSPARTQNGLVKGSPVAKAVTNVEPVIKGRPDGYLNDGMPSRTRSGLVRRSPTFKALRKDGHVINGLPDGWQGQDMPDRTRSGVFKGSSAIKILSKDQPVIKGLADGWLKEDAPLGTRSGLVRGSLSAKAPVEAELITKGHLDGLQKEDNPSGTRKYGRVIEGLPDGWRKEYRPRKTGSLQDPVYIDPVSGYEFRSMKDVRRYLETGDIYQCAMRPKKGSTIYDVHITGSQTITSTSSQHTKPGTADKGIQCEILTSEGIMLPWEELVTQSGNVTEHTVLPESESLEAMQKCGENLETFEHTSVQPVSAPCNQRQTKSLKRKEQNVGVKSKKAKTSPAVTPVRASPRLAALHVQQEASIDPKDLPINVNPISCVHTIEENSNDQSQMSQSGTMNQIHGNLESTFNQLHLRQADTANGMDAIQENTTNHSQPSQVDTVNHIRTNQEKTANGMDAIQENTTNHSQPSQVDIVNHIRTNQEKTANGMDAIQENTTNHSQPSQMDTVNHIHTNQEKTANGMDAIQGNTTNHSQPSQVDTVNHKHTHQEKTANQVESIITDIPVLDDRSITDHVDISTETMQECTADPLSQADIVSHIQTNQEYTANKLQSSLAGTVIPVHSFEEYTFYCSQPSKADTINQIQVNQENTCDRFHLRQVDTVNQMQIIQENMIGQPQLTQADTIGQIHIDLESALDYSQPRKADTVNQLQANQENTANQLHFSQADCVTQSQIMQGDMSKHPQLSQADTVDQININLNDTTNHLQPNYAENPMLQAGFSWPPEQNGGASITDFWKNVENQDSSVPMPVDGATVSSFPENVRFQTAAGTEESALQVQSGTPETGSDQSGLAFQSLFGNAWADPCIEFAFKTLTGDIPVLDDTLAVADYFPEQQSLNKDQAPDCSASVFDNTRNHTQVDVNLPAPMPSDKFYNGSWFPPQ